MQKYIIAILAVTVVVLAGVLLRSRQQIRGLRGHTDAQAAALDEAKEQQRQTAARNEALSTEAEALKARVTELQTPAKPVDTPATAQAAPPTRADAAAKSPDFMGKLAEMMQNPEMQEAMRAQQKLMLPMLYGALFTKLGLDPEALDQLKELLLNRQMAGMTMLAKGDRKAQMAAFEEARRESDQALKELLAEEQYRVFQDYEATVGERMLIGQLNQQLTDKNMPLEEVQQEELVTLMVEERAKLKLPSLSDPQAMWGDGMPSVEAFEKLLLQQEEFNRSVYARSGDILSPAQQAELQTLQANQTQAQRLGVQMMKGFSGGEGN